MKFSYAPLPVNPASEIIDTIVLAEELGFHGAYFPDETYHKDAWLIAAVAARQTQRIRLSPVRDPRHPQGPDDSRAAPIATLDELSDGRAEAVFAHREHRHARPVRRRLEVEAARFAGLREAHHVLRTMLDEGKIDFEGEFYRYSGLFTAARPVQDARAVRRSVPMSRSQGLSSWPARSPTACITARALLSRGDCTTRRSTSAVGRRAGRPRSCPSSTSAPGWFTCA